METYVYLSEEGYLIGLGNTPYTDGLQEPVALPDDLTDENWTSYRLVDGALVLDTGRAAINQDTEQIAHKAELARKALEEIMIETAVKDASVDQVITLSPLLPEWTPKPHKRNDAVREGALPYRAMHDINPPYSAKPPSEQSTLWKLLHGTTPETALPFVAEGHNPYMAGEWAVWDSTPYQCARDNVSHSPADAPDAWERWVDPDAVEPEPGDDAQLDTDEGITDWKPYNVLDPSTHVYYGDLRRHKGKVWRSMINGKNVYEPGAPGIDDRYWVVV